MPRTPFRAWWRHRAAAQMNIRYFQSRGKRSQAHIVTTHRARHPATPPDAEDALEGSKVAAVEVSTKGHPRDIRG
eukprot:3474263-Pyramimonas_sp.AAC.1